MEHLAPDHRAEPPGAPPKAARDAVAAAHPELAGPAQSELTGPAEPELTGAAQHRAAEGEPAAPGSAGARPPRSWGEELLALDLAIYAAVAGTPTPRLDRVLRPLTAAADHSKLWFATAGVMAVVGGSSGRRAALHGVASIAMASALANQPLKRLTRRRRPDRDAALVPQARRVPMPTSTSFPSGHSASAFAFAQGVGHTQPALGAALRLAAVTVAYSRVHAGVHYPGDVLVGTLTGVACGEAAPRVLGAVARRIEG